MVSNFKCFPFAKVLDTHQAASRSQVANAVFETAAQTRIQLEKKQRKCFLLLVLSNEMDRYQVKYVSMLAHNQSQPQTADRLALWNAKTNKCPVLPKTSQSDVFTTSGDT